MKVLKFIIFLQFYLGGIVLFKLRCEFRGIFYVYIRMTSKIIRLSFSKLCRLILIMLYFTMMLNVYFILKKNKLYPIQGYSLK